MTHFRALILNEGQTPVQIDFLSYTIFNEGFCVNHMNILLDIPSQTLSYLGP